ncbi:MAG: (2Fe-2S)-binding protein [Deltaproteobacteria bacterium]|nr:MAG: (2Fe-2S)-binding protein [Deltaproteobacteria bacterium]
MQANRRSLLQRLLGKPQTGKPASAECWQHDQGKLVIDLLKVPELREPGSAIRLEGKGLPLRILVVLGNDQRYRAYHNRCTHLGHRRLDPVPGTSTLQCCSVSKSTFAVDGKVIAGPAPRPIRCYPVEKVEEKLIITLTAQ